MPHIYAGDDGQYGVPGSSYTSPQELDDLISSIATDSVTLYLHGGLVSRMRGKKSAEKFEAGMGDKTTTLNLIWESDIKTILSQNLGDALETIATTVLFERAKKVLGAKFIGHGISEPSGEEIIKQIKLDHRGNISTENEWIAEFTDDLNKLQQEDEEFAQEMESIEPEINQHRKAWLPIKAIKVLAIVLTKSTIRFFNGRNHEFIPTLLEEILREVYGDVVGEFFWSEMKKKVALMFANGQADERVGTGLLERLERLSVERANEGKELNLNIVGHSAGTIAACHALNTIVASYPNIRINKIVFVAAAVTTEMAVNSIVEHKDRFNGFRLFTMKDEFEQEDSVAFLYTASLLYLISGLFEGDNDKALAGMMRFYNSADFVDRDFVPQWREYINEDGRLVLSVTDHGAPIGFQSNATTHGGFSTEEKTLPSIAHYVHN
ncbi:hypothetical protein [Vibrio aestuarianus]|uniref:hypothetical protein n=1 Tax=Vibrio aestuarianus TaxID=28171 RepID=UPI00237CA0B9|nr:hypothetical protein [Vibrio aestuarianus]MDE1239802.1 hypothetical protein [Vibrio aestuarianus]